MARCILCNSLLALHLQDGKTALHHAASGGKVEAVRVLMQEFKLDRNTPDKASCI